MGLFEEALSAQQAGKTDEAIRLYQQLLAEKESADVLANLGVAFRMQGKMPAAIALYKRALALEAGHLSALSNLGGALWAVGETREAIAVLKQAISLNPEMASLYYNLGLAYLDVRQPVEALSSFEQVRLLEPERTDVPVDIARALLQMGNLTRGFEAYESRFAFEKRLVKPFQQPRWDGSALEAKTLLLYSEQGYGDTLQFARYVPLIEKDGGKIIFECPLALKRLMQGVQGIDEVISEGDRYPVFDVHASVFSLPYLFKTTLETIPANIPYFKRSESALKLSVPPDRPLKIGIVWASGHQDTGLRNRTVGLQPFLRLLELPNVSLYSLQKGSHSEELLTLGVSGLIQDLGNEIQDFADTAGVLEQLDLLISADTAIIHLAGALGKPVWALLPYASEWRWLLEKEDSPWYPSLRLFRQEKPGDWPGVMERVLDELKTYRRDFATHEAALCHTALL